MTTQSTKATRWGNQDGTGGSGVVWWTYDRIMEALRAHVTNNSDPLPCTHRSFSDFCKGIEIPTAVAVRRFFDRFADMWLAAGADRKRVTCEGTRWTNEDDNNLMEWAGEFTRVTVARKLMRSEGSVKRRAYDLRIMFRQNAGYLSALEVSRLLDCDVKRIYDAIDHKVLAAHKPARVNNRWAINPEDLTEDVVKAITRIRRREPQKHWTHDEVDQLINLRSSGTTWTEIGKVLDRNYNTCKKRYSQSVERRPAWRAIWHTVRELGGVDIAIVDIERVMTQRGFSVTYSSIRAAANSQPTKLLVSGGILSWVRWTSRRVRPTSDAIEYLGARTS